MDGGGIERVGRRADKDRAGGGILTRVTEFGEFVRQGDEREGGKMWQNLPPGRNRRRITLRLEVDISKGGKPLTLLRPARGERTRRTVVDAIEEEGGRTKPKS